MPARGPSQHDVGTLDTHETAIHAAAAGTNRGVRVVARHPCPEDPDAPEMGFRIDTDSGEVIPPGPVRRGDFDRAQRSEQAYPPVTLLMLNTQEPAVQLAIDGSV